MLRKNFPGRKQKKQKEAIVRQKVAFTTFKQPSDKDKRTFEERYGVKDAS